MALTEVPIELSSTPGIVDNSTATAITIDASQNVTLSANLTVNGDLITFGDANTDSIDFVADIGSNLTPSGTNTYDLGTTLKKWRDAYISGTADIATLSSASSTIGTLTVSTTATIPYDNVTSGLTAINVQSALDELSVLAGGGNVGSQANFDVYEFTATAAQATFDLNATYSETYVPGYIQVYLNGLLLSETDYVASNGSVVVLNDPAELSDILAIVVLDSFNTATQLRVLSIDASASDDAVSVDSSDNVTLLAELRGPATFVIDPAAIGDNTGTVQIKGNLQVDGTQTTINSTTLDVTDLNITVASGAADAAAANGAGITVDGAAANITYTSVTDSWDFNKEIIGSSNIVTSGFNRFVANSTSAGDYVRVYGADGTGKWDIYGNGANLRIGDNESAGIVQIDTGMYVSGPVGIGTSSPDRLIDLRTAPAEDWQLRLGANNTDLDTYDIGRDAGDGLLHFYGNQTGYTGYVFDGINGERMRIDASGNVGIGQAPAALFHVVETDGGAPDAIIRIQSDDTANSKSLIQFLGRNVSNVATYATVHTDAVAAGTNAPIVFSQGASEANERMRIDENGNVGINNPSPYSPLSVTTTGTLPQDKLWYEQVNMLTLNGTRPRAGLSTAATTGGNLYDGDMLFYNMYYAGGADYQWKERMRITSAGNVGIGVSNPLTKLHLDSPITNAQSANSSRSYKLLEGYGYTVGGNYYGQYAIGTSYNSAANTGTLEFFTGSGSSAPTEAMRIDSSGNVEVKGGTLSIFNPALTLQQNLFVSPSTSFAYHEYPANGLIFRDTAGAEAMRIDASGRVGIKTTPDAWKTTWSVLDIGVSGSLFAQDNNTTGLANNLFFNGSNWVHKNTGATVLYQQSEGEHLFYNNASQSAGATFSPTLSMTLDTSGNLLWGGSSVTSPSGAAGPLFLLEGNNPEIVFRDTDGTANTMSMYYINDSLVWYSGSAENLRITNSGNLTVAGVLSKGSGSFRIDHPLPEKTETHHLVHSFVESPQADNIYRGKVDLVDGSATVNIDDAAGMTEGTYVLLNTNTQCFTSNESGWTAVKGSVSGNILTITAQESCSDTISWMVVGERHDQHMLDTEWTDENGKVIVEPLKESQGDAP